MKVFLLCAILGWHSSAIAQTEELTLGIAQIITHPSLDLVRQGALEVLNEKGIQVKVDYKNPEGNMVTMYQIAKNFLGQKPSAFLAIGTPAAQALLQGNSGIPEVFAPITDPLGAKLVDSLEKPSGVATGVSDRSPVKEQLQLIQKILPKAKKIGIIFNNSEANSLVLFEDFKKACQDLKLDHKAAPVAKSLDVRQAAITLVGSGVDAIYIPTDNTVVSVIEGVIGIGKDKKIPVFTAEGESVKKGALASLAFDYKEAGREAGRLLAQILVKTPEQRIKNLPPVVFPKEFALHLNEQTAKFLGITLSPDLLAKAKVRI
jgi:putative ABC transport system substrate-binding protein